MKILVSFSGRAGDLIWALPTVRALSRRTGEKIDLLICGEFLSLVPLLERQPYLDRVVADPSWGMSHGWQPPNREDLISPYEKEIHLGYRRWPELDLAEETRCTYNMLSDRGSLPWIDPGELDLQTPWITNLPAGSPTELAIGFSECHFELKVGLVILLQRLHTPMLVLTHDSRTRWFLERPKGSYPIEVASWLQEAAIIRNAAVFLGCNSGLHVLAVAVGTPVVMMEPMPARWNDIFFPLGKRGPQVTLVVGNDGEPTFDSRHVRDTITRILGELPPRHTRPAT